MSAKSIWYKIVIPGVIIGSLFTFPSRQFLKAYPALKLGMSYNDHVLIGTLAFIAAVVALYKWIYRRSITETV